MAEPGGEPAGAPAPPPPAGGPTLLHFGDLHVWRYGLDWDLYPKRALGLLNLALRRGRAFPERVARLVCERIAAEAADCVLFSGDISTTSLRAEFAAGRELLAPVRARWGEAFIAIPGNHDRYTPRAARGAWFELDFLGQKLELPLRRPLDAAWDLIAYDCSLPRLISSSGRVSPELLARLGELLAEARAAGRRIAVMGHYPLLYPPEVSIKPDHALPRDARHALLRLLESHGVELFMHGHKHRRWALRSGGLLHLNCGSAGMVGGSEAKSPGYLKIALAPSGAAPSIKAHWLAPGAEGAFTWHRRELEPVDLTESQARR